MRVLIFHDALTQDARLDELDVVLQAETVSQALAELGLEHRLAAFGPDLAHNLASIRAFGPDVVFNLVESIDREARLAPLAPAMFDALGLPYTGCGTRGLECTASKLRARRAMVAAGLPIPAAFDAQALRAGVEVPHERYVVKSVWEHGSLGLESDSVVTATSAESLLADIEARQPHLGGEGYAEGYIHGREFNVALLADERGLRCLPVAEIRFADAGTDRALIVGYRAKWHPGSAEDGATPRSFAFEPGDQPLLGRLRDFAVRAFHACDLGGYARIDLRVDGDGEPWIVDANPNPCLTPGSGFRATLAQAGITFAEAVRSMLAVAVRPC